MFNGSNSHTKSPNIHLSAEALKYVADMRESRTPLAMATPEA